MNNSIFNDFVAHFATASLTSLVESFNSQVGNRGFTSARAAHDGKWISFAKRVVLNNNKLEIAG